MILRWLDGQYHARVQSRRYLHVIRRMESGRSAEFHDPGLGICYADSRVVQFASINRKRSVRQPENRPRKFARSVLTDILPGRCCRRPKELHSRLGQCALVLAQRGKGVGAPLQARPLQPIGLYAAACWSWRWPSTNARLRHSGLAVCVRSCAVGRKGVGAPLQARPLQTQRTFREGFVVRVNWPSKNARSAISQFSKKLRRPQFSKKLRRPHELRRPESPGASEAQLRGSPWPP